MKITIQKYLKPTDPTLSSNYFTGNCTLVDTIQFSKVLKDSLPTFKQEYYYQDDIMYLKAGEYELCISTLISEKSWMGNKNVYEFFNNVEPYEEGSLKYLIIIDLTELNKPAGIIQLDTIEASEKNTLINFSVTSIEKEIVEYLDDVNISNFEDRDNIEFETEFLDFLFYRRINSTLLGFRSDLNFLTRIGHKVYINGCFAQRLWSGGLNNNGYSIWDALKSFMITFGFRFMIENDGGSVTAPKFRIVFKWRSSYINDIGEITKFIDYKKSILVNEPRYIFIQTGEMSQGGVSYYIGILFDKNNQYGGDVAPGIGDTRFGRIGYIAAYTGVTGTYTSGTLPVWVVNVDGLKFFPCENTEVISPGFHAQGYIKYGSLSVNVALARTAYVWDWQESMYNLLQLTAYLEYKYLLEGTTAYRKLILDVSEIDLNVGSKAVIDGKDFICEKITSYDDFNKEAECEFRQL